MKTLTLFDYRNGVQSHASILKHHTEHQNSPYAVKDGIVWLYTNPNAHELLKRKEGIEKEIQEINEWIKKTPYVIWTLLDTRCHFLQCRLQLINYTINELSKCQMGIEPINV